jgi:hypothetical protein
VAPRYDHAVIWEPFVLALVLGLIISAGLYFAYLWPSVEPVEPADDAGPERPGAPAASASSGPPAAPPTASPAP